MQQCVFRLLRDVLQLYIFGKSDILCFCPPLGLYGSVVVLNVLKIRSSNLCIIFHLHVLYLVNREVLGLGRSERPQYLTRVITSVWRP